MVERMLCMHEAQGSIPCSSTFCHVLCAPWLEIEQAKGISFTARGSSSLVVMTSALHAEGREFNPPLEYFCQAGTMGERAE
jgi:hypothetical protein